MKSQKSRLGKRIRELRKANNYTQEKLAEMTDLDYTSIGAIERGVFNPSLKTAEKLAKALKISIQELITLPETRPVSEREIYLAKINSRLRKEDIKTLKLVENFIGNIIAWVKSNK